LRLSLETIFASLGLEGFRYHLALKVTGLSHKPVVLKLSILQGYDFVKLL